MLDSTKTGMVQRHAQDVGELHIGELQLRQLAIE